ncbi:hypothetical protein H5T51_05630 [Candidatus Bathyarchaeota archaeon]|nr:hypothetical protein [Candidatus Bathyarchaeota archaeon]
MEGFSEDRRTVDVKVGELTPRSKAVNVKAKVVSKGEVRSVTSGRDGSPHMVCDALIGDETGCIYLTLWDDNIAKVKEGETITIGNGYVSLFRGSMRLNIGKYGTIEVAEEALTGEVNTQNNLSSKVYEQRRPFRRGGRSFGGRKGGYRQRRY